MTIQNTRFGDVEYSFDDIITFSPSMVGFPESKHYLLLNAKPNTPFRWLQSLDEPKLAFLVAFTEALVPKYKPTFSRFDIEEIEIADDSPTMILATATIPPGEPQEMTLNLAAPIIINGATMKAKQVILSDDAYTVKHRVFASTDRVAEKAA
jgi:flagellar assembly factor FliW